MPVFARRVVTDVLAHVLVPRSWMVKRGHDLCEEKRGALTDELS